MNKNRISKNLKRILATCILLVIVIISLEKNIYAINTKEGEVKKTEDCGELLRYIENPVKVNYMEWNGYPAYCADNISGDKEKTEQYLTIEDKPYQVGLWRTLTNGYPYKSLEELGVKTKLEAYTATKCALEVYLRRTQETLYYAIGDQDPEKGAGARTLRAMKQIIHQTESSNEVQKSAKIGIDNNNSYQEGNYFVKEYKIRSAANVGTYKVTISENKIPGIKIEDSNGKEKSAFQINENFKVLIPLEEMKEKGIFKITINSEVETNPILYGTGENNYYIAGVKNEKESEDITADYVENTTKIVITSKDKKTNDILVGSEYQLLDENQKPIYTNLKMNSEGKIILNNLLPGTYYLKETISANGYPILPEIKKIELKFLREVTIAISKEKEELNTENNTENENNTNNENYEIEISDINVYESNEAQNELGQNNNDNIQKTETNSNSIPNYSDVNPSYNLEEFYSYKDAEDYENKEDTITVQAIKAEAPTSSKAAAFQNTEIKKLPVAGM